MTTQLSVMRFVRQQRAVSVRAVRRRFSCRYSSARGMLRALLKKGLLTRGVNGSYCMFDATELAVCPPRKIRLEHARMAREIVIMNGGESRVREVLDAGVPYQAIQMAIRLRLLTRKRPGVITTKSDFVVEGPTEEKVLAAMNPAGQASVFWQIVERMGLDKRHVEMMLRSLVKKKLVKKLARGVYERRG